MDIQALEYFVSLAERGSLTKTASLLHTTQPNLSKRMATLEKELGFDLLERDGRNVKLTQAGASFYECALETLDLLHSGIEEARALSCHELQVVEVGGDLCCDRITAVISRASSYALSSNYPFRIRPNWNYRSVDKLISNIDEPFDSVLNGTDRVAVVFGCNRVYESSLEAVPLYRERIMAVVSCDGKLAGRTEISLAELGEMTIIKARSNRTSGERIDEIFGEAGIAPKRRVQHIGSFEKIGALRKSDEAFMIVESMALYIAEPSVSKVVCLPVADEEAFFEFVAVYRKGDDEAALCAEALRAASASFS